MSWRRGANAMRILIVDRHAVVRRGVKQTLGEAFGSCEFGEAHDGLEALGLALRRKWDLVVLAIELDGRSGLEVLAELKRASPKRRVLVFTRHAKIHYALRALKAGADGYVTRDSALEELVAAVQRVLAGGRYVSSTLAREMALDLSTRAERPLHEKLSNRELEVLRLIGSGMTATQIAATLALSVKTVSYHRSHLLAKLNLKTTAELIRCAINDHLVE